MSEPPPNPPQLTPRRLNFLGRSLGCLVFGPILLLLLFLPTLFLNLDSISFLLCFVRPVIFILGAIVIFSVGPRLLPRFYLWLEGHYLLLLSGALAGGVAALIGIWLPAITIDAQINSQFPGAGAGATLVAMFVGSPLAILLGPWVGAIGGLITGLIGGRLIGKSPGLLLSYGVFGGALAGFVAGVLPYVIIQLWATATGTPGLLPR